MMHAQWTDEEEVMYSEYWSDMQMVLLQENKADGVLRQSLRTW